MDAKWIIIEFAINDKLIEGIKVTFGARDGAKDRAWTAREAVRL